MTCTSLPNIFSEHAIIFHIDFLPSVHVSMIWKSTRSDLKLETVTKDILSILFFLKVCYWHLVTQLWAGAVLNSLFYTKTHHHQIYYPGCPLDADVFQCPLEVHWSVYSWAANFAKQFWVNCWHFLCFTNIECTFAACLHWVTDVLWLYFNQFNYCTTPCCPVSLLLVY